MPTHGNQTLENQLIENRDQYIKKMHRQIKEIEKRVKDLEKTAAARNAGVNDEVWEDLEALRNKMDNLNQIFSGLKADDGEFWPEGSKNVSNAYKEVEDFAGAVSKEISRK